MVVINILILLIFLIHMILLIHLILLNKVKNINSINSITIPRVSSKNLDTLENNCLTAPAYAGTECFRFGGILAGSIKSARFLAWNGLNSALAAPKNGMLKGTECRLLLTGICILISNNAFQLTISLKKGQLCPETRPNNFSLVQGSPLIMPIMPLLAWQELTTYFQQNALQRV